MKKKIRVVQYGVGPIGASIVRLMRQKQALVIVGAIDKDPEKAGRDLGLDINVLAETNYGSSDNVVMVGAHLDSVDEGPGINDNGS